MKQSQSSRVLVQEEQPKYHTSSVFPVVPFKSIETIRDEALKIPLNDIIDYIEFLRDSVHHLDLIRDRTTLRHHIKEYCRKLANDEFWSDYKRKCLSWPLLWIWHVHRLHPMAYYDDCTSQLPNNQLISPKMIYVPPLTLWKSRQRSFIPSIDLCAASIRQIPFLEKFRSHILYSVDVRRIHISCFDRVAYNYMLFLRLATCRKFIVPTFEIELMWHVHLRNPVRYRSVTTVMCGNILDRVDINDMQTLETAFDDTKCLWYSTYNPNYRYDSKRKRQQSSVTNNPDVEFPWPTDIETSMWNLSADNATENSDEIGFAGGILVNDRNYYYNKGTSV